MGNQKSRLTNRSSTELNEQEIELLVKDTSLDRDELLDWHKGFIEECPNGRMSKESFKKIYTRLYPVGNANDYCERVFQVFDPPSPSLSGYIDFTDFIMSLSILSMGNVKKKINLAFKLYDLDRNGYVDKQEMLKIVQAIYNLIHDDKNSSAGAAALSRTSVDEILSKLDKNSDNLISRDEFIDGCLSNDSIRSLLVPTT